MEPDLLDEPVSVLAELPGEPRLADPGRTDDRDEPSPPFPGRRVEEVLDEAQLVVAADEWRFERLRPVASADLGDEAERSPRGDGCGLALERLFAGRLECDRARRGALGRLADKHGPGRCDRLEPGGRVDEVAGDHPLVRCPDRDSSLAGQHPGAGRDARPERLDCVDKLQAGPDRPLGVVLMGDRRTPDRHDRVADELLDRPPIAADDIP